MKSMKRLVGRAGNLLAAGAFLLAVAAPVLVTESAFAVGQFSPRKLTMSSQASGDVSTDVNGAAVAAGAGGNGAKANHKFDITTSGNQTVGSVVFQYCTTPIFGTTCTAPGGLDTSTVASIAAISGFAATAPTLDTTTNASTTNFFSIAGNACSGSGTFRQNCILLKRTTPVADSGALSVSFGQGAGTDWIKNPTSAGVFYVRITTFSDNTYTTVVDQGAVAGSVNPGIDITAKVQEKLNFSVSGVYSAPTGGCPALSGSGAINLGDPSNGILDFSTAYDAHSYFRLSTNASNGTSVLYSGDTLKSAQGNTIAAINSGSPGTYDQSRVGSEQFGLALDTLNANYSFTNLSPSSNYDTGSGTITDLGTAKFAFNTASVTTPVQIANVASGVVACDTGDVRYLGNIATTTKAGIYKTTVNYIAVPNF